MKIAYTVRNYNKQGGISRYVAELAEWFSAEHEVHVFTSSWADVNTDKIHFHKVPMTSFEFLKRRKKYALNLLFEIASYRYNTHSIIKKENFDIIHTIGDYSGHCDVYTAQSCHRAWLKIGRSQTSSLVEKLKKSTLNPLHRVILAPEDHIIKTSRKIISVSQGVKKEILQNYAVPADKIEVIPNGVNLEKFNPGNVALYRKVIRKQYNLSEDTFVMIFPAHQFERKGLEYILKAMKKVGNTDIRLLIVGRDDSSKYNQMVKDLGLDKQLIFTGATSTIERLYAASDLMVFPTIYEPFGLVVTEAMATGIPVIVSKIAGAAELMCHMKDGILLNDYANIDELANAITYCIANRDKRTQMGIEARKTAEKYSWNSIAEQTCKLYQNTLKD